MLLQNEFLDCRRIKGFIEEHLDPTLCLKTSRDLWPTFVGQDQNQVTRLLFTSRAASKQKYQWLSTRGSPCSTSLSMQQGAPPPPKNSTNLALLVHAFYIYSIQSLILTQTNNSLVASSNNGTRYMPSCEDSTVTCPYTSQQHYRPKHTPATSRQQYYLTCIRQRSRKVEHVDRWSECVPIK